MKKKITSLLLACCVAGVALLNGCGGQTGGAQSAQTSSADASGAVSSQAETSGKPVTITFWHSLVSGTNLNAVKKIVDDFNKTNKYNITVKQMAQGAYNDCSAKLQQAIAAKNNPEVCMLDRALIPQYLPRNVLEDLTPYCEKDKMDTSDFVDGLMVFSKVDGKLVSLPFNRSTPIFCWNKTAFQEAGLDPDTAPTTYDELMDYAKKLTKAENGKTTRYGFAATIDAGWYLMGMVQQQGKKMLSDDGNTVLFTQDGSGLAALQWWDKMARSGYFQIPAASNAGTVMLQNFYQGKIAMVYVSTGNLGSTIKNTEEAGKFKIGVAPMMKVTTQSCPTGGANLVMLSNISDEKKEAAWEFIKFATNTENAAQFSVTTGYVPTRKSAVESSVIKELWAKYPQYKVAYDQLQFANDTCRSQYFWEYNTMMNKALSSMIVDHKSTPEQALQQMQTEAERLFPGNKK